MQRKVSSIHNLPQRTPEASPIARRKVSSILGQQGEKSPRSVYIPHRKNAAALANFQFIESPTTSTLKDFPQISRSRRDSITSRRSSNCRRKQRRPSLKNKISSLIRRSNPTAARPSVEVDYVEILMSSKTKKKPKKNNNNSKMSESASDESFTMS